MKIAPTAKLIRLIPTLFGTVLAFTMIYYGWDMVARTDQSRFDYDFGDSLLLFGLVWLARIAVGAVELIRRT